MISLSERVATTTAGAIRKGSLVSVPTEKTTVIDRGIPFVVHVTTLQESKRRAKTAQTREPFNPFLPPDPDLLVDRVGPDHLCVLNKFNVLRHHLLIVTRRFEPQEALLSADDFKALTSCMGGMDGLGFYNGGTIAGASQNHKHLQLVPLPLGDGPGETPLDAVIDPDATPGDPIDIPIFDFDHVLIPLGDNSVGRHRAGELHEAYQRASDLIGVHDETQPYNLLVTRRWMLAVPRSREFWRGVSINALGFAGSLLVRNLTELAELEAHGPLSVLKSVVAEDPSP